MIIAIDVGNTNIVLGGFIDNKLSFVARIATDVSKTEDEYATKIRAVLSENDNHTLFLMQEKEKEKPKRKMSPSSLIALNYFNLGGKTLKRDKKDERK